MRKKYVKTQEKGKKIKMDKKFWEGLNFYFNLRFFILKELNQLIKNDKSYFSFS